MSKPAAYLDTPEEDVSVFADCISISGWVYAKGDRLSAVRAWIDKTCIGETQIFFLRPDVCRALSLTSDTRTGFRLLGRYPLGDETPRKVQLQVKAYLNGEEHEIDRREVQLMPGKLSQRPYGGIVSPTETHVLHRENIYGSGPPVERPSGEALQLVQQYLAPGTSVVDLGCGAGAFGPDLLARGHPWLGLEVNPVCLEILARRHLPHRRLTAGSSRFPFADGEFDHAICIEVLEHIAEPDEFLSEAARVIRGRALFSVPNMEVLPYFSVWQAVPWHLLEADHKNFFTRASLRELLARHFARVEVFSYGEHPLRTPDGLPLHYHLFAVAEK